METPSVFWSLDGKEEMKEVDEEVRSKFWGVSQTAKKDTKKYPLNREMFWSQLFVPWGRLVTFP